MLFLENICISNTHQSSFLNVRLKTTTCNNQADISSLMLLLLDSHKAIGHGLDYNMATSNAMLLGKVSKKWKEKQFVVASTNSAKLK